MAKNNVKRRELSAVRMPGFNAEASLYISPTAYCSSGSSGGTTGAVKPAYDEGWCTSEYCRISMYKGNLACICHFPP
jgi:hypothetical protein